MTGKKKDHR